MLIRNILVCATRQDYIGRYVKTATIKPSEAQPPLRSEQRKHTFQQRHLEGENQNKIAQESVLIGIKKE